MKEGPPPLKGRSNPKWAHLGNHRANQMALVGKEALPSFENDLQNDVINDSPFAHCANAKTVHSTVDTKITHLSSNSKDYDK